MSKLPPHIEKLLKNLEPQIQQAFLVAFQKIANSANISALETAIKSGDVERVLRILNMDPSNFSLLDKAISDSFFQGGALAASSVGSVRDPFHGTSFVVSFDGRHVRAEAWVKQHSSNLITEIVNDQKDMIRGFLRSSLEAGRPPRSTAIDLVGKLNKLTGNREGGVIGLTSAQSRWVENARAELLSGDRASLANYLNRVKRDRRFDSVVKEAMKTGAKIQPSQVDNMVSRYRAKLLVYRGETIARTEGITALSNGNFEGFQQMVEKGLVENEKIERTWVSVSDSRTRHSHADLNGKKLTGMQEPFKSETGALMRFPRDRELGATAAETINCRCWMNTRIKYLKR